MPTIASSTTPRPPAGSTAPATPTTVRDAARTAGLAYAAIFVLAIFANFGVRMRLVDPEDARATVSGLAGNEVLVRAGIAAFVVVFLLDVAVAWGLFVVFRDAGRSRALLMAWFRLTYTAFLGVAVVFLVLALEMSTAGKAWSPTGAGREAGVMLALTAFEATWLVGLAAFGVHLVLVGRLVLTSDLAPRALGIVLAVAGAAYLADTLAHLLLPDYAAVADVMLVVVALPSVVGELAFTAWLLARAGRGAAHPTPVAGADSLPPTPVQAG